MREEIKRKKDGREETSGNEEGKIGGWEESAGGVNCYDNRKVQRRKFPYVSKQRL